MKLILSIGASSGIMAKRDIKVRSVASDTILFGDGRQSFVHVTAMMLQGRTGAQKRTLSETLRDRLRQHLPDVESISIDIRDMDPECYRKSFT